MRRLVYALSLSTLFFAVCTAYLARELYLERAGDASSVAALPVPPPPAPATAAKAETAAANAVVPVTRSASTPAAPSPSATPSMREPAAPPRSIRDMPPEVRERITADINERLARFADPAQRAAMFEERKSGFRRAYPGLDEILKMDETEYQRFIDFRVRGEMNMEEASLRCYSEGTCDIGRPMERSRIEAHKREMADLFGQQRVETLDFYMRSTGERQMVAELRGKLPDKYRLMDAQSEALVAAFYEERKRIGVDMSQRGIQVNSFNNVVYTPMIGEAPDENVLQAAEEYNRRMRDRAASVLTPEQLAAFESMQQDAMRDFRTIRTDRAQGAPR